MSAPRMGCPTSIAPYPSVELRDRLVDLLLARLVRCRGELALHFSARQAQGFELPCPFGVTALGALAGFAFFLLALFHPLGEAGFRVDESFSGITHAASLRCQVHPSENDIITES